MLFTEDVSMLISREIIALRFDESILTSKSLLSYLRVPIITNKFPKIKVHFFCFEKCFDLLCFWNRIVIKYKSTRTFKV